MSPLGKDAIKVSMQISGLERLPEFMRERAGGAFNRHTQCPVSHHPLVSPNWQFQGLDLQRNKMVP